MADPTESYAEPGSYRDPLSRVFDVDGQVLRGLRGDGVSDFEALSGTDFYTAALADGRIVATEPVDVPPQLTDAGYDQFLRHERIPFISYPYEWTFSMRRDAALLQLDLAAAALGEKLLTKDATPYNVQFVGTDPTFIDLGSFERLRRGEPWFGYPQFCTLNLYPLLMEAHLDLDPRPWLRGSIDGISPSDAWRLLRHQRRRRGVLTHVGLQARAERKATGESTERSSGERTGIGPALIEKQIANLAATVDGLQWEPPASTWSDYGGRGHYGAEDLATKEAFVAAAIGTRRRLVLDLGANDGRFSRVAAAGADLVVAVDADAAVVERLYRDLRAEPGGRILPLVVDLVDPSPALGWRSGERRAFVERGPADVVLALALIHHLAIGRSVPIDQIIDQFADLGSELVIEVPDHDDPMVALLLSRKRNGLYDHYRTATVERSLERRFRIVSRATLPSGTRTLYHGTRI